MRPPAPHVVTAAFPRLPLFVLSTAMFVTMTSEFLPGGLIPLISEDFGVPISRVGLLMTAFAFTVVATTIPAAWLTRRVARKNLAIAALGGVAAATALASVSPTFEMLLASRVLGGFANGVFWSVGAAYAAHLVIPSQIGRATAVTAAGGSLAAILGIPLGNLLGYAFGWRLAFAAIALLTGAVMVLVACVLPSVEHHVEIRSATGARKRTDGGRGRILAICGLMVLIVVAAVAYGTYSVAWLLEVAELPEGVVPIVLAASGIAGAVGLLLTARLIDRHPAATLYTALGFVVFSLVALPLVAPAPLLVLSAVILYGLSWGSIPTQLQAANMRVASPQGRRFAAALQTTAINVGIGAGALVGGLLTDRVGLAMLPAVAGVLLLAAGLVTVVVDVGWIRRIETTPPPGPSAEPA